MGIALGFLVLLEVVLQLEANGLDEFVAALSEVGVNPFEGLVLFTKALNEGGNEHGGALHLIAEVGILPDELWGFVIHEFDELFGGLLVHEFGDAREFL